MSGDVPVVNDLEVVLTALAPVSASPAVHLPRVDRAPVARAASIRDNAFACFDAEAAITAIIAPADTIVLDLHAHREESSWQLLLHWDRLPLGRLWWRLGLHSLSS